MDITGHFKTAFVPQAGKGINSKARNFTCASKATDTFGDHVIELYQ